MDEAAVMAWRRELVDELTHLFGYEPCQSDEGWLSLLTSVVIERQGRYWSRGAMSEIYCGVSRLMEKGASLDAESIRLFLTGYQAYRQIAPTIKMLDYKYVEPATRVRLYCLPIYVSLAEGCMSNFMRLVVRLIDSVSEKDYSTQDELRSLTDILGKHAFPKLAGSVDSDLRNAINHGGIYVEDGGREIVYRYRSGSKHYEKTLLASQLMRKLHQVFDVASAAVIALTCIFSKNLSLSAWIKSGDTFIRHNLAGVEMSNATCRCAFVSEVPRFKQVDFTFDIIRNDRVHVFAQAERILRRTYELLDEYDQFVVSFDNEHLMNNVFRTTRTEMADYLSDGAVPGDLITRMAKRQDALWSDPKAISDDAGRLEYYRYPEYESLSHTIYEVKDVSRTNKKSVCAAVYVGDEKDKSTLIRIIDESVEWLRKLTNLPSPVFDLKHGNMQADCVYFNVYRHDLRTKREVFETNDNFVCMVEYCSCKKFELPELDRWRKWLYPNKETHGKTRIYWREKHFVTAS